MEAAAQAGLHMEDEKYRKETQNARKALAQFNMDGLWVGNHGEPNTSKTKWKSPTVTNTPTINRIITPNQVALNTMNEIHCFYLLHLGSIRCCLTISRYFTNMGACPVQYFLAPYSLMNTTTKLSLPPFLPHILRGILTNSCHTFFV